MFKKTYLIVLFILPLTFSGAVQAADPTLQLASEKGCFVCHSVKKTVSDTKPLAPSYEDIYQRYKDDNRSFDYLVNRVLQGSAYTQQNWPDHSSMRFMPANVNVNREEAAALVHWILQDEGSSEISAKQTQKLVLAKNAGCMTCHRVEPLGDNRVIPLAPSFKEIAAFYDKDKKTRNKLVLAVQQGTQAKDKTWHNANMRFMPPNPQLRDDDAMALVDWIMGLKP